MARKRTRKAEVETKRSKKNNASKENRAPSKRQLVVDEILPKIVEIVKEPESAKSVQRNFLMPEYTKPEMIHIGNISMAMSPGEILPNYGYPYVVEGIGRSQMFFIVAPRKRMGSGENSPERSQDNCSYLPFSDADIKTCSRCRNLFSVSTNGPCFYHDAKRTQYSPFYSCCGGIGNSIGCRTADFHVWSGVVVGLNGPFDCIVAEPASYAFKHRVIAIDCEMCYTKNGLELTRLTVLDLRGDVIYDTLVLPEDPIIDYNTRYSGISKETFENAGSVASLKEVQENLLQLIDSYTIIVGHGLENDFRALRLAHFSVIDTALIFNDCDKAGIWKRPSLKKLCYWYLNRNIQSGEGHDSVEDAKSCLDLLNRVIGMDKSYSGRL